MTTAAPQADFSLPGGAVFSGCRHYRHVLWRSWQPELGCVTFIGLNPSTADAEHDDPTIRRCTRYVSDWGYGAMVMVNLFDVRATQPSDMKRRAKPLSRKNDAALLVAARQAKLIVAAWGGHGQHRARSSAVRELLRINHLTPSCFGIGATGEPLHPLYQRRERRADVALDLENREPLLV